MHDGPMSDGHTKLGCHARLADPRDPRDPGYLNQALAPAGDPTPDQPPTQCWLDAMNQNTGLSGWSSPAGGSVWPDRGPAIGAWLVTGIEAWREIETRYRGKGTPASNDEADRLTIHPHVRSGEIGRTALLITAGATEMLRGLAALYLAHRQFALTRAHLPIFRSLQEHCGRVMWLLEPGTAIGPSPGTLPDDAYFTRNTAAFYERAARMRMLNEELLDDRLAGARKQADVKQEQQATHDGGLSQDARKRARRQAGDVFPGYALFAEICEARTQQLHLTVPGRTRAPYGRVSETSHGTLLGLLSDTQPGPDGTRRFTSDEPDLEAVAASAGCWWETAIALCCAYLGWEWELDFQAFDDAYQALFV